MGESTRWYRELREHLERLDAAGLQPELAEVARRAGARPDRLAIL